MSTNPDPLTLYPYLHHGCWVFDDERTGLKEEAFVLGATEMITRVVASKGIPRAEKGFSLTFSGTPFPGHDVELRWLRSESTGGDWYAGEVVGQRMEAWLCPALLLYFRQPPPRIYVRCDQLPPGIDPIWTPPADGTGRRFVGPPESEPGVRSDDAPCADRVERFDIPSKPTLIEVFRALRGYVERLAAVEGRKLDPQWYADSPEEAPHLYKDQPHLLKNPEAD